MRSPTPTSFGLLASVLATLTVPTLVMPTIAQAATDAPVGHWRFDERRGTTAADASGAGNDATLATGAGWGRGQLGGALAVGGGMARATVANRASWAQPGTAFTASFWVRVDQATPGATTVASGTRLSIAIDGDAWSFRVATARGLVGSVQDLLDGNRLHCIGRTGTMAYLANPDGAFHHVALAVDAAAGRCDFWVDGVLAGTDSSVGGDVNLGSSALDLGKGLVGALDEVRLYDRAIGSSDVLALRAAGFEPEAPRETVDLAYHLPLGGRTIPVASGGDLQAALDAAALGDVVELEAGGRWVGNFVLPKKSGTGWLHVRTAAHALLPAPGERISECDAANLATIVTVNDAPALRTASGAHHVRLIGLEITTTWTRTDASQYGLVRLEGIDAGPQTTLAAVPHHIVIDRSWVHGTAEGNVRRGLAMNAASVGVVGSLFSDFHENGADSQAIVAWNGPGPFAIVNNRLEAAGENVMFGGADPTILDLVPADIEIRGNHFTKPLEWRDTDAWSVKNLFELKNARRVLVEGNRFEHNWLDSQNGFSILLTVRNQGGTAPWSVVEDVRFERNVVRHVGGGVNLTGSDDLQTSEPTARIRIAGNLFDDVDPFWADGLNGVFLQVLHGPSDLTVEHNTVVQGGTAVKVADAPAVRSRLRDNVFAHGPYGVFGNNVGTGRPALETYFPGGIFEGNVLWGAPAMASSYPAGNAFPATIEDVGFVDLGSGDYRLSPSSPYAGGATDGTDPGADHDALDGVGGPPPSCF